MLVVLNPANALGRESHSHLRMRRMAIGQRFCCRLIHWRRALLDRLDSVNPIRSLLPFGERAQIPESTVRKDSQWLRDDRESWATRSICELRPLPLLEQRDKSLEHRRSLRPLRNLHLDLLEQTLDPFAVLLGKQGLDLRH